MDPELDTAPAAVPYYIRLGLGVQQRWLSVRHDMSILPEDICDSIALGSYSLTYA